MSNNTTSIFSVSSIAGIRLGLLMVITFLKVPLSSISMAANTPLLSSTMRMVPCFVIWKIIAMQI